jgi:hypothetical protein
MPINIEADPVLPSQKPRRRWRSRPVPLAEVWESEILPLPVGTPGLLATTVLQHLHEQHPGRFHDPSTFKIDPHHCIPGPNIFWR